MTSKTIVTTTINEPTEALKLYMSMKSWSVIIVGDNKTPHESYASLPSHCAYLSPHDQSRLFPRLSESIGWNCIQRRNIGFALAVREGATLIATVDDDNIPSEGWGDTSAMDGKLEVQEFEANSSGWFDPISVTSEPTLWHRGFPIQELQNRTFPKAGKNSNKVFDVQANFWNGDPDIDAICRMEHAPNSSFEGPFPFSSSGMTPFNSQNTIVRRHVMRDYFMFPKVGRMDDIWASFHAQTMGHQVVFDRPTVTQDRNDHDLTTDFSGEILGYLNNYKMMPEIRNNPGTLAKFMDAESWKAFMNYQEVIDQVS